MSERVGLTACIVAMNEEDRIERCLDSVAFCDETIVVDSHSTDRTRELAAARGVRVIERDWPGFLAQKKFAIAEASNEWVLVVDADEWVSPKLAREVQRLRDAGFPGKAGWRIPRLSSFLGMWMRRGGWYPDLQLRLFDRRRGHWQGEDPHPRIEVEGAVGRLAGDLCHHPYRSFDEHLKTIETYTSVLSRGMFERGRRARPLDLVLRPAMYFFRFYVLKLGLLAGWRGLLQAYLAAHYARMKYAKLLILQTEGTDRDPD